MDVYFTFRSAALAQLRQQVRWWEQLNAAGVLVPDHLFVAGGDTPRSEARRGSDPLVLLSAVAALSDRLTLGTSVSNIGFLHPALVLRQFAQLAALVGGQRVLAGLGAGWNREEFDALGMRMPSFADRMDRLEEAARLARDLFDHGSASLEGAHVQARELPMAPQPETPPRLLLGGGSERLLDIAGRYADVLDLNGTSQAGALRGRNLPQSDMQRRLSTTIAGLEGSYKHVEQVARSVGRPTPRMSVLINYIVFCRESERQDQMHQMRTQAGLPAGSLDECPYVLVGERERMRAQLAECQARFGLEALILSSAFPPESAERFVDQVINQR